MPQAMKATTLQETALTILKAGPDYKADSLGFETYKWAMMSESNLPDPSIAGEYLFAPVSEDNRWGAVISWEMDWPGLYSAKKKQSRLQLNSAEKSVWLSRIERLARIKGLLVDYIFQQKKISLIDKQLAGNDSVNTLADRMTAGGEITKLDLSKIKLENIVLLTSRMGVMDEMQMTLSELSSIYGRDCIPLLEKMDCEFPIPADLDLTVIGPSSLMKAEIETADAKAKMAENERKVTSMGNYPSISFGYKHAYEEMTHFNGLTLGFSLPFFSNRHKGKETQIAAEEAAFEAERVRENAELETSLLARRIEILKIRMDEIETILRANDYPSLLLKSYEGGLITLTDYLTECNYFINAELELLSLRHSISSMLLKLDLDLMSR